MSVSPSMTADSEVEAIRMTAESFYKAFSDRDAHKMKEVWADSRAYGFIYLIMPEIKLHIHAGRIRYLGEAWPEIFQKLTPLHRNIDNSNDITLLSSGDLATFLGTENTSIQHDQERKTYKSYALMNFQKVSGKWRVTNYYSAQIQ